jgi:hypothetical protein
LRRNERGAGFTNGESDDGGLDEFRLFCPNCRRNSPHYDQQTGAKINQPRRARPSVCIAGL